MRLKPSGFGAPRMTSPYCETSAPTISFLLFPALIPFSTSPHRHPRLADAPVTTSPQLQGQMSWLVISCAGSFPLAGSGAAKAAIAVATRPNAMKARRSLTRISPRGAGASCRSAR